jgi:hypothetical protein
MDKNRSFVRVCSIARLPRHHEPNKKPAHQREQQVENHRFS